MDTGVAIDLPSHPQLVVKKVGYGTANLAEGPAMSREQAIRAVEAGIDVVEAEVARGLDVVGTGDMGIGNTTPSSAIVAAITGAAVAKVTGRGTGVDDVGLARKVAVIERALALNRPDPTDALDVLAKVGGFEIAGLAGVMLGAAANRVAVVVDGFISGAAALIAAGLSPAVVPYMIAGHPLRRGRARLRAGPPGTEAPPGSPDAPGGGHRRRAGDLGGGGGDQGAGRDGDLR